MKSDRTTPPASVPTLTEVVTVPGVGGAPGEGDALVNGRADVAPMDPYKQREGDTSTMRAAAVEPSIESTSGEVAGAPPPSSSGMVTLPNADQLTQRILADVERQVEQVLEYRVREALTPVLTRLTDALVRDARTELSSTLRDVIARSVAQELRRQRIG